MTQSDADAARALLDQLMTERAVDEDVVAPPEAASVPRPPAPRPLPPPPPDPWDGPLPPSPPESREYHIVHQPQACRQCGAPISVTREWCERCLTPH